VLFLEAITTVRDERWQDNELLEACAAGVARGSIKMRAACLQAQADRASPIVLKAILRAVGVAYTDFAESVSTPGKLLIVVLFALTSVFAPIASWAKAFLPKDDMVHGSSHVVVVTDDSARALCRPAIGFRQRVSKALRFRNRSNNSGFEDFCDEEGSNCLFDVTPYGHYKAD
jgi:hypothetical protein